MKSVLCIFINDSQKYISPHDNGKFYREEQHGEEERQQVCLQK